MLASITVLLQELTGEQITTLSLITLAIVQGFKIIYVGLLKKPKPSKERMRLFVFLVSVPLGLVFSGLRLPAASDPMAFAQALIATAGQVLIFSGLAYEYMLDGVFSWLDKPITKRLGRALLAP